MVRIRRRRNLPVLFALLVGAGALAAAARPAPRASVAGRLVVLDRGGRSAADVGEAVVWLEGAGLPRAAPAEERIDTERKRFVPHVLVVAAGSAVAFPNHDPFAHNVFSRTEGAAFDLGLYERGETPSTRFARAGVVRVHCNVHAQMSAVVVVRDNAAWARPSSDGSFRLPEVPPGDYVLHAWHERAPELTRPIAVPPGGVRDLALEMDARGWRYRPHLDKNGKPYPKQGRRY
jgi:plastocyanin